MGSTKLINEKNKDHNQCSNEIKDIIEIYNNFLFTRYAAVQSLESKKEYSKCGGLD